MQPSQTNSGGSIGIGKPRKEKDKRNARSRGREAGAGACEILPTLIAIEETRNIPGIKDRHRHGLCNIAREKTERKRSVKNEIYHPVRYEDTAKAEGERGDGDLARPRHRTTSATVCVIRAHLHGLR